MDFQQLMKQASANQSSVQKKHELKKKQMEERKKEEEKEKRGQVKRASAVLQDMKKSYEKKQLAYRGIMSSRAADFEKAAIKPSPSLPSSASSGQRKANCDRTTPSNDRPRPTPTSNIQTAANKSESSKLVKTKSVISKPTSVPKTSVTAIPKSSQPSTSATSSASARHQKPPVNFQDLMKLAEKKSTHMGQVKDGPESQGGFTAGKSVLKAEKCFSDKSERRAREGSPLGKQLLEKSYSRSKQRKIVNGSDREGGSGEKKGVRCGMRDCTTSSMGAHEPTIDRSSVGSSLRALAQSRIVNRGTKAGSNDRTGKAVGERPSGRGKDSGRDQRLPESAVLMRERFRRELETSALPKQVNGSRGQGVNTPKSFYGDAHAQLLSKEGRQKFPSKGPAGPHQNSWVSELSGYMEQMRNDAEEDEDECSGEEFDDLDDFVVDDEEGDDVSSAIREIFGYDKGRYRDEDYDDRMMESSFVQQQFEEMRSSRIGRQEDAEDMKREAERQSRKRRKGPSTGPKGLKQSKFSF